MSAALVALEQPERPSAHLVRAHAWGLIELAQHQMTAAWSVPDIQAYGVALLERAAACRDMADALIELGLSKEARSWATWSEADRRRAEEIGPLVLAYALQVRP